MFDFRMQGTQVETETRSTLAGAIRHGAGTKFDFSMLGTQDHTETRSTLAGATRRGHKFRLQYARNTG
jgi:hypothetical protein